MAIILIPVDTNRFLMELNLEMRHGSTSEGEGDP